MFYFKGPDDGRTGPEGAVDSFRAGLQSANAGRQDYSATVTVLLSV